jgi:fumarylacetoacetate (FAA) hydrolase
MRLARLDIDGEVIAAVIGTEQATPVGGGTQGELLAIAMGESPPDPIASPIPLEAAKFLPPIESPPSLRDFYVFEEHARNSRGGADVDPAWFENPVFYFSNPAAIYGPEEAIPMPRGARAVDYELEVACVIGREVRDADPHDPNVMSNIAGFAILNDWSARDLQAREMKLDFGPVKGKDFATSFGPMLVTPDEFGATTNPRPNAVMKARVNGREVSRGNLADMHFSWAEMVAYASANTRLVPGDILGSGTCGSGCLLEWRMRGHRDENPWLRAGDVVELEVDGLGVLRNVVGGVSVE